MPLLLLAAAAVVGKSAVPVPSKTPVNPTKTTVRHLRRDSLPPLARSILAQRMELHAQVMTEMFWSVVFLEHDSAVDAAQAILHEPTIARPLKGAGADDLSSSLPSRFFDLQDDLKARAAEMSDAAARGNDAEIAKAWGRLSETCVNCHAVYLEPETP